MVDDLKYSDFIRFWKASKMLEACERIQLIEHSSFPNYKPQSRSQIMKNLRRQCRIFLDSDVKDFQSVVKNLAKRMMPGG